MISLNQNQLKHKQKLKYIIIVTHTHTHKMSETSALILPECIVNAVPNKDYLKHLLLQQNPFPLAGIEHYFTPYEDNNHKYCKFCGYGENNINHVNK